jgi:hypothetical protein
MTNLIKKYVPIIPGLIIAASCLNVYAQGDIPWLAEYTGEMVVGNDTYQYAFTTVEQNECKVKFKEFVTDRKGDKESRSWIFYLSDLDPDALQFKARGKAISVTLATVRSQEFVSAFEGDEFDGYTEEMVLTMNEVDQARQLIGAIREHIAACSETETTWTNREEALEWLTSNIGDATDDDVKWKQQFSSGDEPHLVVLTAKSIDQKGEEEASEYLFDLSDIDPLNIELEVSGRSLHVDLFAKGKERYIQHTTDEGNEYVQSLSIYTDDIEEARRIVQALGYAASNTEAARPVWEDYNQALEYIKAHHEEVNIDGDTYSLDLEYDLFASDIMNLQVTIEEADGEREETIYSFYPADMTEAPQLEVDRDEVIVHLETEGDRDFIRKSSGGVVTGYDSDLEFHASGIDEARNLIGAWEYIIENSEEELESFGSVDEVNTWLGNNFPDLYRDGTTFTQVLSVNGEMNNQLTFEATEGEEGGEETENRYIIYPEDIDKEALEIQVRFGKLTVTLETGRENYIRHFEKGVVQNFTDDADVYFFDPLVAKNFMEAIRFLITDVSRREVPELSREEAIEFLSGMIPVIELPEVSHEQALEVLEPENCKIKFTRVETEKDKSGEEFVFEFMASDLSESDSDLSVKGNLLEINLETSGNRDLVKPFENGEVQDFTDGFVIYADDVLQAKKILNAFITLSKACD